MPDELDVIPSPEAEELKRECQNLQEELAKLCTEKDHLLFTVAPNIEAVYATTIGPKEYEAFQLKIEVRSLKCTIEKIQAIENRGEKPNLEQVEAAVQEELEEWHVKIAEMLENIKAGESQLQHQMTDEDSQQFQTLYRTLAKKLHPDINPDHGENQKTLWQRVQQAYQTGDLEELRVLSLLTEDIPEDFTPSGFEELRSRRSRLKQKVGEKLRQINEIKQGHPFDLEKKLDDSGWVAARLSQCQEVINQLAEKKAELEAWMSEWKNK